MIYPEKMLRVTIVSPKIYLKDVINALYNAKALHIQKFKPKEGISIGEPLKDAEKISELILKLNAIKSHLKFRQGKVTGLTLNEIENVIERIKKEVKRISDKEKEYIERLKNIREEIVQLEFIISCGIHSLSVLQEYKNVFILAGQIDKIHILRDSLNEFDVIVFYSEKRHGKHNVIIFGRNSEREKILIKLSEIGFDRMELKTDWKFEEAEKELEKLKSEKEEIEKKLMKVKNQFEILSKRYGKMLFGIEKKLTEMIRKSEAPLYFASTKFTFIITGWIPENYKETLISAVKKISEGIYVRIEKCHDGPTKLNNPKLIKPFEFFVNLYTLPKLGEIDPTFLVFFTFPLFYGMMLGDIGYGLVILCVFTFLKFKLKRFQNLIDITILSAIFTIFFGFLFGEFFGAEEIFGYHLHPYLHRLHEMNELILISIIFGLVHITVGFIFGFVNELKEEGIKKAVLTKLSWLIIETGGVLFALNMFGVMKVNAWLSVGLFFIGVIMLGIGEGFMGLVELPSLLSNILSYARLAAVGLASASLAVLVNDMAGGMFQSGGIFIIMGMGILLIGHTINILLGMLDAFLQSLRLHYVEMFTKFYHGNGTPYKPFGS